jgi:hypothetical protein
MVSAFTNSGHNVPVFHDILLPGRVVVLEAVIKLSGGGAIMARIQLKMKRYRQAINTWRRMIVFLTEENNELKLRLAEILKDTTSSPGLIEEAEEYLGAFTQQDEVIFLARADIAALELLVTREAFEQETAFKKMDKKYKQLQKEMEKLEREFNAMKHKFNMFLTAMP